VIVILRGVSGAGKSTIGNTLADRLGWSFIDADDHHPPANRDKMRAGQPLDDNDRMPWLARLRERLDEHRDHNESAVLACSALKRVYLDQLGAGLPGTCTVQLTGDFALIERRVNARRHAFMSPRLLRSQFDTLEPVPGEIRIDVTGDVDSIVAAIMAHLDVIG